MKLKRLILGGAILAAVHTGLVWADYRMHMKNEGIESPISSPRITTLSNGWIGQDGGDLTVSGTDFLDGALITVNTTDAATSFISEHELYITAPGQEPGLASVTVTNPDGGVYTLNDAIEYKPAPNITSVAPASGSGAGGESVLISGTEFTSDTQVFFGGVPATIDQRWGDYRIDVLTPEYPDGGVVTVTTSNDYGTRELAEAYAFSVPTQVNLSFHGTLSGTTSFSNLGTLTVNGGSGDFTYNWVNLGYSWNSGASWNSPTGTRPLLVGFGGKFCDEVGSDKGSAPTFQKVYKYNGCRSTTDSPWYKLRVEVIDNVTGETSVSNDAILRTSYGS